MVMEMICSPVVHKLEGSRREKTYVGLRKESGCVWSGGGRESKLVDGISSDYALMGFLDVGECLPVVGLRSIS